jgi:flagellar protein FliO/FliZ
VRGPGSFELAWPLLIVLALIVAAAWCFRRWMPRGGPSTSRAALHVIARHPLSNKQSLVVVRLGQRVVLLGITPDRIATLADIDDPDEAALLVADLQRAHPDSFTSVFRRFTTDESPVGPRSAEPAAAGATAVGRVVQAGDSVFGLLQRVQSMSEVKPTPRPT